ncbi:hypothetical protein COX27_00910 [Candidatus Kuenenbacteria bacterium CG23_combo_of_CG06-09_8_20_14_all_36_9]|nr:MAG: hypothetical protein COX27_00910 [Candidatus Kuenenbacteria bacterium CG23_combo_of_CG06-09_8_20_14_all_36_9]
MHKLFFLLIFFLIASPVFAIGEADESVSFDNPVPSLQGKSISDIVGQVIKTALGVIGSIALVLFIIAGFIWMNAKGEAGKINSATKIMQWTAIGLAVIFFSYAMLKFVFGIIK